MLDWADNKTYNIQKDTTDLLWENKRCERTVL